METRIDMSVYNGHNIMSIVDSTETKYPTRIGFGLKKAQMIVENIEAIKAFVQANEAQSNAEPAIVPPPVPQ